MLGDFLRFCSHHGFGGLALLALAGWAALFVVLAAIFAALVSVLEGAKWVRARFGEGFPRTVASLIPSAQPMARLDSQAHGAQRGPQPRGSHRR